MNKTKTLIAATIVALLSATSANACLAACKEKKRDEAYSKPLTTATLQTIVDNSLPQKAVDPELGAPYAVYPIEVNPYDKVFHSTLVEYPFGSSPRTVSPVSSPRGIVLYVHGYNDYFFQEELAEKSDSAGFAFFAIDLHYNGRSYREGDPRSDMRSVKEYYAEMDAAVALSKKIAEIRRVLKDDGLLIAPNFFFREGGKKNLWQKFLSLVGIHFAHEWTEKEYKAFLESNGWSIKMDHVIKGRIDLIYVECA